ncbi:ABC transporter permease [Gelidibacter salicanalis]|uniref:ABC transporter permease n=1 Tax=Gelidibacter salicanalis TaxID=291193 RepID=A0A934KL99_9FLAO|nr:ABC transporter permease [Gelidibacter salicanalis]MBJ7879844.1 ABC transporter permease [Gelidibacter salicanalis]
MIRNYFKIALRNLWKDRTFTALNVIGLTAAFGVAFLLSMYALFELSFDQFHKNVDSIYQVYTTEQIPKGVELSEANPIPFAGALRDEVPGVHKITRYVTGGPLITYKDKTLRVGSAWADPEFFEIFSFPVLEGNTNNPIERSTVALTEDTAKLIFGNENPIGKLISIKRDGEVVPVTVAAILKNLPEASSLRFGAIFNFMDLPNSFYKDKKDRWDAHNHPVYMQLAAGTSIESFEKATRPFSTLHFADEIATAKRDGAKPNAEGQFRQIHLLPFGNVSFTNFDTAELIVNKSLQYVILGIALLILFIASVNFINMSIAKGAQRLREIGMRKTLGAGKAQLFFQFWGESVLVFVISVALGALLSFSMLDMFQTLFRTNASFGLIVSPVLIFGAVVSLLLITFIAGGYPAVLMSKLGTLKALKGKLEVSGRNRVRNVLIVVQFGIAILLISGTLVLRGQLDYMRNKDLGFNKEQVIAFPLSSKKDHAQLMQLMRDELSGHPNIISMSASDNILGLGRDGSSSTSVMGFDYKGREVSTNLLFVDYDYPETLDITLVKGRSFDRRYASDSLSIVINESMAREFGEKDPLSIRFTLDDSIQYAVIGVVKDFNFQTMDKSIEPISFFMNSDKPLYQAYVKVAPGNLTQSYDIVKTAWNKIEPDAEFLGSFLDENIDRTLQKERMMTTMISSASILAILLSCIGLFAISLLVVSQRQKEIGIRKVVGASVSTITILLTKDFLKLVGIAFLITTPVAWYTTSQWLQNYVYRMDLTIWVFLAAGAIALVIAVLTISFRTIQAALKNPVESLKTE